MPSIQTLVADLNNGSIVGIGAKPDANETNLDRVISGTCRVKYKFVHMNASITGANRLSCQSAAYSPNFNGSYIHFEDAWSTVGNMDVNRRIVASGNFSGCAYKIYQSLPDHPGPPAFKCVHIARPGGVGANALVNLMDSYARQNRWTEIRYVSTTGLIGVSGCTEVFVVSQLFIHKRIDTIRLAINSQGLIVGHDLYSDVV